MNKMIIRTTRLFAFLLALSLSFASAKAADWYVKTTGNNATGTGSAASPYRTITFAISKAAPGDVIHIGTGTFTEQVEIAKNLTLIGEGPAATIIAAPATLPVSFYRDIQYLPLVYAHDAANVVIKNLSADGNTFESATAAFAGIAYSQAGGLVDNVKISTAPNPVPYSNQLGYGFLANADNNTARNITLSNSTIISYQRFAAGFLGKDLTGTADGNTILGAGKTDAVTQNGILVSLQAAATVKNNTIKNFMYTGGNLTAIGIYAIDAKPVTITGNQLTDCQTAIFCINSTGTQITQNRIVFNAATYDDNIDYSWGVLVEKGNYTVSQNEIDGGGEGT
ncbi:MAG: DUF1565 domain-containing protein, partial [Chitinophagaceae bacterium]